MYATKNCRTAKELREAVAAGERIGIFQPGVGAGREPREGVVVIEGPHFPKPHTYYVRAQIKDGVIVKVLR
jgi:hypothetical protein